MEGSMILLMFLMLVIILLCKGMIEEKNKKIVMM